jgi:hypothetical protein
MWIIIGLIIGLFVGTILLVLWVRHRIVMDTVTDFGMSGTYAYLKHGLWHLGVSSDR